MWAATDGRSRRCAAVARRRVYDGPCAVISALPHESGERREIRAAAVNEDTRGLYG